MIVLCMFDIVNVSAGRSYPGCLLNALSKKYEDCNCSEIFGLESTKTHMTTELRRDYFPLSLSSFRNDFLQKTKFFANDFAIV